MKKDKKSFPVEKTILAEIQVILDKKGSKAKVNGKSPLFRSGVMDSLDLAELIIRCEALFGLDPFKKGISSIRTVGDLIRCYETKNQNKK